MVKNNPRGKIKSPPLWKIIILKYIPIIFLIFIFLSFVYFILSNNHSKNLRDRCDFGPEFPCLDWKFDGKSNELEFELKNKEEFNIVIDSIDFSSFSSIPFECSDRSNAHIGKEIKQNEIIKFIFGDCNYKDVFSNLDRKEKIKVNITYYNIEWSSEYSRLVRGNIYSKIK